MMSPMGSVLITGCSDGGIGSGLALVFQERGYHVFATVRDPEKASALKNLPNVTLLTLEVTHLSDILAAKHIVSVQTGGILSYLINNAGRNHFMPLLDEDIDTAKEIFNINVWGPLAMTQAFAPLLMKANGTLVNITSIAGHGAIPTLGSYGASKRCQEHMADVLRLELSPFGVKVLSVVTGAISTNCLTYFQDWTLPPDSPYMEIEEYFSRFVQDTNGMPRTPLESYATEVVENILGGITGRIWVGERAEKMKNASLEGELAFSRCFMKGFGLDLLLK
ncbi:U2 snRNP component prp10 [Penicillium atrosanguineum]|uniref:U2 snRNP component prp10 n=1 Tax=Penicillium atrosanguineum TaxID=1132637 RepID=UPI0023A58DCD|nr:U2 snRNP component prp10 [Penicillium atrosanguineum]KAJ5304897.1 U2 snRNP component prp10 [Penicillium atrosanguineum]